MLLYRIPLFIIKSSDFSFASGKGDRVHPHLPHPFQAPSIDLTNVWLPVEEEIVVLVDETEIEPIDKIVPIQQCIFDPSIGEYGGFELKLENF